MDLRVLHSEAMDLAERAVMARARGHNSAAALHLKAALQKEERAARLAVAENIGEPTRSVLLKSAAHLAANTSNLRLAEQLAAMGLAGEPPDEIARELRGILEEVSFHRHLDLNGIELQHNEVQLVLEGQAIAPGLAAADEFTGRVDTVTRLVQRTSECDRGVEYREQGSPRQDIERSLRVYLSVPRAASFAVSLRVASEKSETVLPYAESADVLDRVFNRLGMYDREEYANLRKEIPQSDYYDKFIELASTLAPDGERVRLVGLTMTRNGTERTLAMRRPVGSDARTSVFVPSYVHRQFLGRVFFFNAKDQENIVIKLETDSGEEFRLKADNDLLQKVARYAVKGARVSIKGVQIRKSVLQVDEFRPTRSAKRGADTTKRKK